MSRGLSSFLLKGKLIRICITKLDKQNSSHFTTPTTAFSRPPCPYSYCIYSSVCLLYLYSSNFIFWHTILHVYICVTNERKNYSVSLWTCCSTLIAVYVCWYPCLFVHFHEYKLSVFHLHVVQFSYQNQLCSSIHKCIKSISFLNDVNEIL